MQQAYIRGALATSLAVAAALVVVPSAGAAGRWCPEKPVDYKVRGSGTFLVVNYGESLADLVESEMDGGKLQFSGPAYYETRGVRVTFKIGKVRYTVRSGSRFLPSCALPTSIRRDIPAPYLTEGRIDVKAPRRATLHGVGSYNGVFYTRERDRTKFVVTRRLKAEYKGLDTLRVKRGKAMTATPYMSNQPHPCRSGRRITMNWHGRVRGG